jgi:NitT/TauT family transport system substrate-binding protein
MMKFVFAALALLVSSLAASAQTDTLKVAISQRFFWDSSFVEFAEKAGFFKEAGLTVEPFYTDGGAATLTTVLSGSTDIGLSNGLLGVIGAYVKGAPVRIISAQMTGAGELYWYVKSDSPIQSLKDPAIKTVAFSSPGSSSNLILLALLKQAGSNAKTVATGGAPATLTQVMTGQIDVGWAAAPFGLRQLTENQIRVIARTTDVPQLANQTIRVNIANENALKTKRAAIEKFMRVYARAIDWAYQNQSAIDIFADNMKLPNDIAKKAVAEFYPKAGLQIGEVKGLDLTLQDALDYKYIPSAKTAQEIAPLFDILYKPGQ